MRFAAEQNDPENKGLEKARRVLEGIHNKHKYLSLADIFILAGYVALEATGGPVIPFSSGRRDFSEEQAQQVYGPSLCPVGDGKLNPCGSRLPAADLGPAPDVSAAAPPEKREKPTIDHVRNTFHRMGLSDKETVLLIIMGHQYGRMHPEVSGYEHTWYAFDPNHWNVYGPGGLGYLTAYAMQARNGLNPEHQNSAGKRQFSMQLGGGVFSMLPVDMALLWDPEFRKIALWYDRHRLDFHRDAAVAWKKLTELGCDGLLTPEATPGHAKVSIEHIH
jgi:catalase (peroxidase I)